MTYHRQLAALIAELQAALPPQSAQGAQMAITPPPKGHPA
jgi:hypothetical protein